MDKLFEKIFVPENLKINETPLITFAFYGDAVHTLMVRGYFLGQNVLVSNNLHTKCSKFCSAKSQALALDCLKEILTDEENEIIRRTRNTKTHKPPKNCDLEIYKKATCFETLFGYLFLTKQFARLETLFNQIMPKEKVC